MAKQLLYNVAACIKVPYVQTPVNPEGKSNTCSIFSTVQVVLGAVDVYSDILCEGSHKHCIEALSMVV